MTRLTISPPVAAWLIATALSLGIGSMLGIVGPAIDDNSAEFSQAQDIEDAIKAEAEQARFDRSAQAMCGDNAAWRLTDTPGEVQCLTKRGHKTIVAQVVQP